MSGNNWLYTTNNKRATGNANEAITNLAGGCGPTQYPGNCLCNAFCPQPLGFTLTFEVAGGQTFHCQDLDAGVQTPKCSFSWGPSGGTLCCSAYNGAYTGSATCGFGTVMYHNDPVEYDFSEPYAQNRSSGYILCPEWDCTVPIYALATVAAGPGFDGICPDSPWCGVYVHITLGAQLPNCPGPPCPYYNADGTLNTPDDSSALGNTLSACHCGGGGPPREQGEDGDPEEPGYYPYLPDPAGICYEAVGQACIDASMPAGAINVPVVFTAGSLYGVVSNITVTPFYNYSDCTQTGGCPPPPPAYPPVQPPGTNPAPGGGPTDNTPCAPCQSTTVCSACPNCTPTNVYINFVAITLASTGSPVTCTLAGVTQTYAVVSGIFPGPGVSAFQLPQVGACLYEYTAVDGITVSVWSGTGTSGSPISTTTYFPVVTVNATGGGGPSISVIAGPYVLFCNYAESLNCFGSVGPYSNQASIAPCDSCNVSEGIALSSTGNCFLAPCGNPPPVPPCLTTTCPGFADQGGTLPSSLTLNLAAGSIVGFVNPDTDSAAGSCSEETYSYSQTTFSWPAQTIAMSAGGEGIPCLWTQADVQSVTVTRQFYSDEAGEDLICSETDSQNPSWSICLNTTTGLWEIDNSLFGLLPGIPVGTTGCVGGESLWATLCHFNDPTGTYTDGSTVTSGDGFREELVRPPSTIQNLPPKKCGGCTRAKSIDRRAV